MSTLEGIPVRRDRRRGCGFRKPGGLYLVCEGYGEDCALLPIPVPACPTCGSGIHPTRGWTWIRTDLVLAEFLVPHGTPEHARRCPLSEPGRLDDRVGLLWIGGVYYPEPAAFSREARALGVSRRIAAVPRGFKLGQWVMLAHRATPIHGSDRIEPAIFHAFRPSAIEYVCRGDESNAELVALEQRGVTPVRVLRELEQTELEV